MVVNNSHPGINDAKFLKNSGVLAASSSAGNPNITNKHDLVNWEDFKWSVDFGLLLFSILLAIVWFTFLTYYFSRLIGFILSRLVNRFLKAGHVQIGSFSVSILSGKIMFRDLAYVTENFSIRIHDGWVVFRYWKWYRSQTLGTDFSHADHTLQTQLNGLEFHAYNQFEKYRQLDKLYNLGFFAANEDTDFLMEKDESSGGDEALSDVKKRDWHVSSLTKELWRSLFPVVKFEISLGRVVFGNHTLPNTLVISFQDVVGDYTTKAPSNTQDLFMHSARGNCENFRIAMVKSPGYKGEYDKPPRTMGEGFVMVQSASLEFYYFQDALGLVQATTGQDLEQDRPAWGIHFRLGKNTVISYGPWVDKQRDAIYKLFYPPDYQVAEVALMPRKGQRRVFVNFDLRVMTLNDGSMDILFLRDDVLNAIHVGMKQGSYVEVNVPWNVGPEGFQSTVKGLLMHVELASSLEYRQVAECETLAFTVDMVYPRVWNALQVWNFDFVVSKATVWLVYPLKDFLQDLMEECSDPSPPDLYKFVPYIWNFSLSFKDFELLVMINEYNWIDTSSQNEENCQAGVRGQELVVEFSLNFSSFLPAILSPEFLFTAKTLQLLLRFPEQHSMSHVLHSLHSTVDESLSDIVESRSAKFWESLITGKEWLLVWMSSGASISLTFHYHPAPHLHKPSLPAHHLQAMGIKDAAGPRDFDRTVLEPDLIELGFELNPSTLFFTTAIVKYLLIFKQNYLGECQNFTEIRDFGNKSVKKPFGNVSDSSFDPRTYRPLSVKVSILLSKIEAYALTHRDLRENVKPPVVRIEQLSFEMDKTHSETQLQLGLSPVSAFFEGKTPVDNGALKMEGFQLRGHAMFSEAGLPLDSPTVEYGWLTELILGKITGKVSPHNCVQIIQFLNTSMFLLMNGEEELSCPKSMDLCQHMQPRTLCFFSHQEEDLCPTEHDLKYKFVRLSIDAVDVCLVENCSAVQITTANIRLATCTFHQFQGKEGVTLSVPELQVEQFIQSVPNETPNKRWSPSDLLGENTERPRTGRLISPERTPLWLKCGHLILRKTDLTLQVPLVSKERFEHQRNFLLLHDDKSRRLPFIWAKTPTGPDEILSFTCGCRGGCAFFGSNEHGKYFFQEDRFPMAQLLIKPSSQFDPGFGQSILREGEGILLPNVGEFTKERPEWGKSRMQSAEDDDFYMAEQDMADFFTPKTLSPRDRDRDSDAFSFKSTMSHKEEPTVNLYGQVNRPVLTSPMLMAGYEKSLDHYQCLNWQKNYSNQRELKPLHFQLLKRGLNSANLIHDPAKQAEILKLSRSRGPLGNKKDKKKKTESVYGKIHRFESHLPGSATGNAMDISATLAEQIDIMLSPLSIESLERLLNSAADELCAIKPFYSVQKQFSSCSGKKHDQSLTRLKPFADENQFAINAQIRCPRINLLVLQCGVVEKLIAFSDLSSVSALTQTSALSVTISNSRIVAATSDHVDSTEQNTFSDVPRKEDDSRLLFLAESDGVFAQLVQASESNSEIGISRNASRIPYYCDWSHIPEMQHLQPCIFMESGIEWGSVRASFNLSPNAHEIHETLRPASPLEDSSLSSPDPGGDDSEDSAISKAAIDVGPIITNFALLRPLEESQDSWPIYDILAPTLSAWLHVFHRFQIAVSKVCDEDAYSNNMVVLWLLTEALDFNTEKLISPVSKFAPAKIHAEKLKACPSCQILMALLRYCSWKKDKTSIRQSFNEISDRMSSRRLQIALLALLSHWQTVLCAEQTVIINSSIARHLLEKDSKNEMPEKPSDSDNSPTDDTLPELKKELLHKDEVVIEMEELNAQSDNERTSGGISEDHSQSDNPGRVGKPKTRKRTTASPSATLERSIKTEPSTSATDNLYQWMKDQQKTIRSQRRVKSNVANIDHVNPMDLPLSVYFEPFLSAQGLKGRVTGIPLLRRIGGALGFSFWLDEIKFGIVEPKLLPMVGTKSNRLGFTERHLLGFDGLSATGQLRHEFGKLDYIGKDPVLRVNYHMNCRNTVCTLGVTSASFLNQISFVIKSLLETKSDLLVDAERFEDARDGLDSPTPPKKYSGEESHSVSRSREGTKSVTRSREGTKSTETVDSPATSSLEEPLEWTEKMMGILRDYQRAQRRSERFRHHSKQSIDMPVSLVVFGVVDFKLVSIQAMMKELAVFVTIHNLQFGHSWRERKSTGMFVKKTAETQVSAQVHKGLLILSEGDISLDSSSGSRPIRAEGRSTILNVTVEASRLLFSRQLQRNKSEWDNSLLVEIGPVMGDVPMHPGFLHGVVVRTSRNIQKEFERLNPPTLIFEDRELQKRKEAHTSIGQYSRAVERENPVIVVSFSLTLSSLKLKAQLLPSVWATYHLEGASSNGTTGSDAKFIVEAPSHNIVFCVTTEKTVTTEQPPKPIQVDLPCITGNGAYIHEKLASKQSEAATKDDKTLIYQEGGYLKIEVEIGKFEHTLTTYLLNQILFVQEAFRREIGEIVARITAEKPGLVAPSSASPRNRNPILFSLEIHGPANPPCVQITATTPTSTAIRLTIDELQGQLTNRWLHRQSKNKRERLFGAGTIHLSIVLGQFVKPATYEEVEAEFQQFAYFKTQVHMQNVESGTEVPEASMAAGSYTYLINVHRPVVFIQPSAVDKAVLLWLNYKNTYEFWNEQRQQIRSRTPAVRHSSFIMSPDEPGNNPLFLKLSVDSGLHICMPLYSVQYPETNAALLVSLENTEIAVCSLGALVSQGSFTGFCVRFAENFDAVAENWSPEEELNSEFANSNSCYVPEGTYDVCSRTSAPTDTCANAEWYLNVHWRMKGVDLQLNSKIGKLTSLTMTTLTSIAGEGEESITVPGSERESSVPGSEAPEFSDSVDGLEDLNSYPSGKQRTKLIEKAMNDQALNVSALKTWGATEATIEIERRKLQKLEVALFNEFRREMVEKLRRQSQKAVSLKDRLGLGVRPQSSSVSMPRQSTIDIPPSASRRLSEVPRKNILRTFRAGSLDAYVDVLPSIPATSEEDIQDESIDRSSVSSVDDGGTDATSIRWRPTDPIPVLDESSYPPYNEQISEVSTAQPSVNLYLDVKIIIESGICSLKTQQKESDGEQSAPTSARHKPGSKHKGRHKSGSNFLAPPPVTKTLIAMPSLSVSSYYSSHSNTESSGAGISHMQAAGLDEAAVSAIAMSKKAQFYMYTALESMPDETVVSPHLVDFLQETLEPLPQSQNILPWGQVEDSAAPKPEDTTITDAATLTVVSFPVDFVLYFLVQSSTIRFTSQPLSMVECLLKLPRLHLVCTSRKSSDLVVPFETGSGHSHRRHHSSGSIRSQTNPTTDEEVMSGGISITASLKDFSLFIFHPYGATSSNTDGPMHRRDALSLSVDAITVNMSRSRNLLTAAESNRDMKNSVKFSLVVDVNKACFRYDMRRLKEILSFPKAWYRRNIMRRFFLGDESASTTSSQDIGKGGRAGDPSSQRSTPKPTHAETKASAKIGSSGEKGSWEALVLYALRCEELEVEANMGQTMGLTSWVTKEAMLHGHIGLNSKGNKNLRMAMELASSNLEARTGVISGLIALSQLGLQCMAKKDAGRPPHHMLGATLGKSEARIEWMSTAMFIGRSVGLNAQLEDEWLTVPGENGVIDQSQVFVNGKIRWKELQIMITKTTVNDLIRIFNKLGEFFEQQVKRGRQVLFFPSMKEKASTSAADQTEPPVVLRHHHHWQLPLQLITDIQLTLKFFPLPRLSTVVGGTLDLSGEEISLSCFHGSNFRAPTWALFYMREPAITFEADARDIIMSEEDIGTLVSQTLTFRLGSEYSVRRADQTMSIVARVQQGRFMPPSPGTIEELLIYAQGSVLKQVYGNESKDQGKYPHSVVQLFRFPAFELELRTSQRQADEEPSLEQSRPTVNCAFVAEFHDHLFVSSNVEALYFLHELINAYMQEKQTTGASSGRAASSASLDPKLIRIGHPLEELQLDGRDYNCETWVLEPTVRFIEVGPYEPFGVDYILQKLGFRHARVTIPKWMQRGFMDPLDGLLAILMEKTLTLAKRT